MLYYKLMSLDRTKSREAYN